MFPEDIQNRARNALSPIHMLNETIRQLLKSDIKSPEFLESYNWLKTSDICDKVDKSIKKLILLAKGADTKIDDETFDIEKFIKNEE